MEIVKIGLGEIVPQMGKDMSVPGEETAAEAADSKESETGRDTVGVYGAMGVTGGEDKAAQEIFCRANLFASNLRRMLELKPDETFILAFDSDIGKDQHSQIMPLYKAIDELRDMKDSEGKPLFPNLVVLRKSATHKGLTLADEIKQKLHDTGAKNENVFIVTRSGNTGNGVFSNLEGAWIAGIDDSAADQFNYLPVFEAATLLIMSAVVTDIEKITELYNSISEEEITSEVIEQMIIDRNFYILPKMAPIKPEELRELYEKVQKIYLAA
jgi:hypothetical protein